MMTITFKPFKEGFIGAFTLAAAIVIAVFSVASAFVSGDAVGQIKGNGLHHS